MEVPLAKDIAIVLSTVAKAIGNKVWVSRLSKITSVFLIGMPERVNAKDVATGLSVKGLSVGLVNLSLGLGPRHEGQENPDGGINQMAGGCGVHYCFERGADPS